MSFRRRILLSMLSAVAISGGVVAFIGVNLLWRHLSREAQNRVRQDLNATREFYDQRIEAMESALRYTALGERFSQGVADKDIAYLAPRLEAVRRRAHLDTLCVTDAKGDVTHRAHRPGHSGGSLAGDKLVGSVLTEGKAVSGTMLIPLAALREDDPLLAERAQIPILPTPGAKPSDSTELNSGMMLCSAAPVHAADGSLAGVLRAGILLGRNYDLVDQVQNTVFRDEQYRGRLLGTATIFQGDVRISTNVLHEDGSRAIGTRVSDEVRDCVLARGETWVARAWVVNDWYISAYAPVYDVERQIIGMLYIGVRAQKFDDIAARTFTTFAFVALAGLAAAAFAAWKLADTISRPVRRLAAASAAVAQGDFSQTLVVRSADEIGSLTQAFNTMAKSLKERDALLKERTRLQLTRSERLASIGRLAAGVAHEINNPLTGVLTFAHILLENAPDDSQEKEDIETIIEATTRCKEITRGLLNFSRQAEPRKRPVKVNDLLCEALNLTRNQARISRVSITEEMDPALPCVAIDPNQMQEVAVNVIVNAIDAMPDGGNLTVRTRAVNEDSSRWVEFEISDSGCGISPENVDRIFDPFFTTKPTGKGTGLGLAVSYGTVTEHGGTINVTSTENHGTTVTVRLPVATEEHSDE